MQAITLTKNNAIYGRSGALQLIDQAIETLARALQQHYITMLALPHLQQFARQMGAGALTVLQYNVA